VESLQPSSGVCFWSDAPVRVTNLDTVKTSGYLYIDLTQEESKKGKCEGPRECQNGVEICQRGRHGIASNVSVANDLEQRVG
jgi:hypothetical protein